MLTFEQFIEERFPGSEEFRAGIKSTVANAKTVAKKAPPKPAGTKPAVKESEELDEAIDTGNEHYKKGLAAGRKGEAYNPPYGSGANAVKHASAGVDAGHAERKAKGLPKYSKGMQAAGFRESVEIDEAVSVEGHDRYEYAHGHKPRGQGNWIFSSHKSIDFSKHKEGADYMKHNGSFTDAQKAAKSWAKTQGHTTVHVQT